MKSLIILPVLLIYFLIPYQSYADCQGCCSWHGGVVCVNGITRCADGTSLSSVCRSKGCNACYSPPIIDPDDIDDDGDGYTENQGDCNDTNSSVCPFANEICEDGIDQDCDGKDTICPENIDDDGDGYTENQGDCEDTNASISPIAIDLCGDGIDQNCDGKDEQCPNIVPIIMLLLD